MNAGEKSRPRKIAGFLGTKSQQHEQRAQPGEWDATKLSKEIEMTSTEDTAWEIYNRKAALYDMELVKDWNDSLNTLLIFAALYSAVLTAFITESMRLLREDASETTRDILLVISRQLANSSIPAFEYTSYTPPSYAVRVNSFFFTSILCSLIAAFGSVLSLQWVGNYDFGLNTSSPKDHALQRHLRYEAVKEWKMAEIIAFLPILLFLALFLFLVGLADWLYNTHRTIAIIITTGAAVVSLFYSITTLLSAVDVAAPFRTPVSKSLPLFLDAMFGTMRGVTTSFIRSRGRNKFTPPTHHSFSFTNREEERVKKKSSLKLDSLLWAVNSVGVLPHARKTFMTLIEGFMELPTQVLNNPEVNNAPWSDIFIIICRPYFGKANRGDYSEEELKSGELQLLSQGLAMIGNKPFNQDSSKQIKAFLVSLTETENENLEDGIAAYAWHARWRHVQGDKRLGAVCSLNATLKNALHLPDRFLNMAFTNLHGEHIRKPLLFGPWSFSAVNYSSRRRLRLKSAEGSLQDCVALHCCVKPGEVITKNLFPIKYMDIILRMLSIDLLGHSDPWCPPLENYHPAYSNASNQSSRHPLHASLLTYLLAFSDAEMNGKVEDRHQNALLAIQSQLVARLIQSLQTIRLSLELEHWVWLIYMTISTGSRQTQIALRSALLATASGPAVNERLWQIPEDDIMRVTSLLFCESPLLGSHPLEWFMRVSFDCEKQLDAGYGADATYHTLLMRLLCQTFDNTQRRWYDDKLLSICNPSVALAVSTRVGFPTSFPALSSPSPLTSLELWKDGIWQETVRWCCRYMQTYWYREKFEDAFVGIMRATLEYGSPATQGICIETLPSLGYDYHSNILFELFKAPTLQHLLTVPGDSIRRDRLRILELIAERPWFYEEFSKADGFSWLEREIPLLNDIQENRECIKFLFDGLYSIEFVETVDSLDSPNHTQTQNSTGPDSYSKLRTYLGFVRHCLVRRPFQRGNQVQFPEEVRRLRSILRRQKEQRSIAVDTQKITISDPYSPVRTWSAAEWREWSAFVEEIIAGLECGYISDIQPRIYSDPDGMCISILHKNLSSTPSKSAVRQDSGSSGFDYEAFDGYLGNNYGALR